MARWLALGVAQFQRLPPMPPIAGAMSRAAAPLGENFIAADGAFAMPLMVI